MDEKKRLEARELLLKSRIYRVIALVFAVMGVAIFALLYFKFIEGDVLSALRKPHLVLFVIIPFLPAFILSRIAFKAEDKLRKILETIQPAQEEPAAEQPEQPASEEKKKI